MSQALDSAAREPLRLFEGVGIEIEYMIVDAAHLSVNAVADQVLESAAGEPVMEVERGPIAWSNELAKHVIELKTNGPAANLVGLGEQFHASVLDVERFLAPLEARLLPTAMHPWMDPYRELVLWDQGDRTIYSAFDRIFDCRGHGWANLQSVHVNLPFAGDEEFARLHAAIRFVLPLLPALAASSPFAEGRRSKVFDTRLQYYRTNAARVPSVLGRVVPESASSRAEYESTILQPIYRDLSQYDPQGILCHEWVNGRGAIARFDRDAIEIRVLDVQECPGADLAIALAAIAAVRSCVDQRYLDLGRQQQWDTGRLAEQFSQCLAAGDNAVISDRDYVDAFAFPERGRCRARELWHHIIETVVREEPGASEAEAFLAVYVREGCLARRLVEAVERLDARHGRDALTHVFRRAAECLRAGTSFDVATAV